MSARCPICHGVIQPGITNKSFPFCSNRCKQVDLGAWLGEGYILSRPIDPDKDHDAIVQVLENEPN